MTAVALTGIGQLVTNAAPVFGTGPLGEIPDAALVVERGRIAWVGAAADVPVADEQLDVAGRCVLPGFVDSHTHPIFAGDRSADFVARMTGEEGYSAGGIRTTVTATRAAPDELLADNLARIAVELRRQGTTTFEAKSGYGLTVADERRALALSRLLTSETTFLGGHVVPEEYEGRAEEYVDLVRGPMLREAVPYARWIDVFCEPWSTSAFDKDQSRAILEAGRDAGLGLRVHAGQLGPGPGVQLACELGAASADHCTYLDGSDVTALADSSVVATLLPGVEFSTRSPYCDARRLLDAGVTVALATDCNPGTSYTTSMSFCIALAVRELGMTPAEAVWAATAGGAQALARDDVGTLRPGARADILILDAPNYVHLAYRPGVVLTQVWSPEAGESTAE